MTIRYVDPRGRPLVELEPYTLRVEDDAGVVVGVLANGFPDSGRFAQHVAAELRGAWPGVEVRLYDKRDASSIASPQLLDGIAAECHAAVTLYGH